MTRSKDLEKNPLYHVTASWGWMNDPCAPGFDPTTGLYHIFYQWNPKGCEWGNMSWGHLTSKDMIVWKRTGPQPALAPDTSYDDKGVFTGCLHPTGIRNSEPGITLFYSSITGPPFSWERPPYPRNSAGIAAAITKDHGISWTKVQENPILLGEPDDLEVTGFRDPYVASWESLDRTNNKEGSLYAVIAGGIRWKGPCIFLYTIDPSDILKWKYSGILLQTDVAFRPSRKWSGCAGVNWECPSFMTLTSDTASREFVLFGTEGGAERDHIPPPTPIISKLPQRVRRWCMWISGELKKRFDKPVMEYKFGGMLDHGCFYAASSFHDVKRNCRVVWGWIIEDDITLSQCQAKGWTGCLSIPRELFLLELKNVVGARKSSLSEISCADVADDGENGSTVRTLGIRPLTELLSLRASPPSSDTKISIQGSGSKPLFNTSTSKWELKVEVDINTTCSVFALQLIHNRHGDQTEIIFSPLKEEIIVKRPGRNIPKSKKTSSTDPTWLMNNREERGAHTLFRIKATEDGQSQETFEALRLHIFRDGQVLEIFANDRFAMSTMIYVDQPANEYVDEIRCLAEGSDLSRPTVSIENASLWHLDKAVLPEDFERVKPVESSVQSSL